ncbi:CAP domain-containing protein [Dokdonia sp. Dokd-P16]|uniref:CAP domain-containing protein n=1 Tax=Dokdonia sp. Dokd-P16 TaxID=2173169 RepID=UPI000D54890A|nr:CAP domain-containing protein [Dokdonia sp. Dokd-P16]AWH73649.1 CAP domain-containing protein [Dokdonia sp. Dokd-P16]
MKLISQTLYALVALCLLSACTSEESTEIDTLANLETTIEVENNIELAEEVLDVLNDYRASLGLSALQWHTDSENLAVGHSSYMVAQNAASHDNFYERAAILQENGADMVSENVAYGFRDAASVLEGWLNSPAHKQAIEGDYTHTGVGIVMTETGIPYYTQLFIR